MRSWWLVSGSGIGKPVGYDAYATALVEIKTAVLMVVFGKQVGIHAFQTIDDYEYFEDFEAEMLACGESLPVVDSAVADAADFRRSCQSAAVWACKTTIVAYDQFISTTRDRTVDR